MGSFPLVFEVYRPQERLKPQMFIEANRKSERAIAQTLDYLLKTRSTITSMKTTDEYVSRAIAPSQYFNR